MNKTTIQITQETWKILTMLKAELGIKSFDELIKAIVKEHKEKK